MPSKGFRTNVMNARSLMLLALLTLGTLVHVSPAEADRTAFLDTTFGATGRVMLPPLDSEREVRAAIMPDDGLVISTGRTLRRIGPDGQLDGSFGGDGTVNPPAPPDGEIEIEGLAVDLQGRLIVAATAEPVVEDSALGFGNGIGERPKVAWVGRYLRDGTPDPSFGKDGRLETDFGLQPPRDESGEPIVAKPWVEVTGVAVDSQNRIVLTGGISADLKSGCAHDWFFDTLTYAAFVARLTPTGSLDSSFAGDGVFGGSRAGENPLQAEVSAAPAIGPQDEVVYGTGLRHCPRDGGASGLGRVSPSGAADRGFGLRGAVRGGFGAPVVQSDGRIAGIGLEGTWYYAKESARVAVDRLTPSGHPDRTFGTQGKAVLRTPGGPVSELSILAPGGRGRLLLGGTMYTRRPGKPKKPRHSSLILMRLTAGGRLDRSFAPRGRVATGFGSRTLGASQLLVDSRGRAVLVGTYGPWEHQGVAVARFAISR